MFSTLHVVALWYLTLTNSMPTLYIESRPQGMHITQVATSGTTCVVGPHSHVPPHPPLPLPRMASIPHC